jgi:hypothetical protein
MFGKAEWFRTSGGFLRVRPATWRGWLYSLAWGAALVLPAVMLLDLGRLPETLIWVAALGGLGWLEMRSIRQALKRDSDDVFVIDESTDITKLSTENYDMTLRG